MYTVGIFNILIHSFSLHRSNKNLLIEHGILSGNASNISDVTYQHAFQEANKTIAGLRECSLARELDAVSVLL